jgi:zinc/manganese transport system substrate-binding protein
MLGTILIFTKRSGIAVIATAMVLAACSSAGTDSPTTSTTSTTSMTTPASEVSPDLTIVATTSIAGDLVSQVVGDRASVEVLMPIGADPHDFQPSSRQVAALRSADLVVAWGLGLEEGLEAVLESAVEDGVRVLELSALVDPIAFGEGGVDHDHADHDDDHADHDDDHADHDDDHADHDDDHADHDDDHADHDDDHTDHDDDHADDDHGHDHGGLDPHTWMDPVRMAQAVREIGLALNELAPGEDWLAEADRAASELMAVHAEIEEIFSVIPDDRRKLVTNHDSLGYLAARYDFEVVGVAIPGGSTLASPSSAQVASLVEAIRDSGVRILFAETTSPAALLEAIADEVEGVSVVEILEASLAARGQPGDTLVGMLLHNARLIAEALTSW